MIGWYVHDRGSGHRRRLEAVAAHLQEPVTGMGSGEPAAGVDWLALPPDTTAGRDTDPVLTGPWIAGPAFTDPTAGGALHWAPLGEPGLLGRTEAVAAWVRRTGCRLLVVDVSVEMLLLGRLLGLPTVAVLQPGERTDPAHALGYATAAALLAPWPRSAQGPDPRDEATTLTGRTRWTGAFSRFDGRAPETWRATCPDGRCAVLALGRGGHGVRAADVRAAASATPGWHWHVAGDLAAPIEGDLAGDLAAHVAGDLAGRVVEHGVVADVWPLLSGADVVVGPCGGGLAADVAAAGAPFLALPQSRPFDEQAALGRLLQQAGVAVVAQTWPDADAWPRLLDRLAADPAATARRWRSWSDGDGAARAAAVVAEVAGRHPSPARPSPPPAPVAAPVVVHVPADHDYVRHATTTPATAPTAPTGDDHDDHDDHGDRGDRGPQEAFTFSGGQRWLADHGAGVDVLHVHFGAEQVDAEGLDAVLSAAQQADVAVVWTAHDLTNPHLVDQDVHEAQLALLARRAAGLITLTAGAAAEVERRWGRRPVVVPHPHLAPVEVLGRPRPDRSGRPVVGVPLGMLRPATDPAVVRALLGPEVAAALPAGTVLRVTLREEVVTPGFPRPDAALVDELRRAQAEGRVDLVIGPRSVAADLWDELSRLSALVLPYRWGTHSGWVEACHDVGTPVVAPALGRWLEQQTVHPFAVGPDGPDPVSIASAVAAALAQPPRRGTVLDARLHERRASVATHDRLHALAAAGERW